MDTKTFNEFLKSVHESVVNLIRREVQVISLTLEIEKPLALNKCINDVIKNQSTRLRFDNEIDFTTINSNEDLAEIVKKSIEFVEWNRYAENVFKTEGDGLTILSVPLEIKQHNLKGIQLISIETEWKYSLYDMLHYLRNSEWQKS